MRVGGFDIRCCVLVLLILVLLPSHSEARKRRDFKGLFGNYRRDKFVENPAKATSFSVNLLLSTLLPVTQVVRSQKTAAPTLTDDSLHYATFFNFEIEAVLSLAYHWQFFARVGYHTYSTEREQSISGNVQIHRFSIKAFPILGGIKYRFSRSDVVPYIGVGLGISHVERNATFDFNSTAQDLDVSKVFTGELQLGVEFYFGSSAGLRLEIAPYYMKLAERVYNPGGSLPSFTYRQNPIFVRYASGLFVTF